MQFYQDPVDATDEEDSPATAAMGATVHIFSIHIQQGMINLVQPYATHLYYSRTMFGKTRHREECVGDLGE